MWATRRWHGRGMGGGGGSGTWRSRTRGRVAAQLAQHRGIGEGVVPCWLPPKGSPTASPVAPNHATASLTAPNHFVPAWALTRRRGQSGGMGVGHGSVTLVLEDRVAEEMGSGGGKLGQER